ncbi:MAG TPA: hypothetical protein ENJ55_07700 [Rhizobiales bacterium]|nr:hypothetical protein [Hyphomicrobiales bacterium]
MSKRQGYVGLETDLEQGDGITPIAKIVLDARLFGLIPDSENCKNWPGGKIQELYDRVARAWEPYGNLPSRLPEELREKHARLYDPAITAARQGGWDPDRDLENDR